MNNVAKNIHFFKRLQVLSLASTFYKMAVVAVAV